jgi:hypothetical protein
VLRFERTKQGGGIFMKGTLFIFDHIDYLTSNMSPEESFFGPKTFSIKFLVKNRPKVPFIKIASPGLFPLPPLFFQPKGVSFTNFTESGEIIAGGGECRMFVDAFSPIQPISPN